MLQNFFKMLQVISVLLNFLFSVLQKRITVSTKIGSSINAFNIHDNKKIRSPNQNIRMISEELCERIVSYTFCNRLFF